MGMRKGVISLLDSRLCLGLSSPTLCVRNAKRPKRLEHTIERRPGPVCFTSKFSSYKERLVALFDRQRAERTGNLSPYIENEPVPSLLIKSPP